MDIDKHVEQLKKGNDEAFAEIYAYYETPLFNHLNQMLGNRERAEEIFQETMLTMIKKIDFYSPRKELQNSFKAWVFRIGTNLAIDVIRKNKKANIEFEQSYQESAEVVVEKIDFSQKLGDLIFKLPSVQRTFLNLRVNEDLSHFEISVICGCSVNSVKQGLFRARKSMKLLLEDEGVVL